MCPLPGRCKIIVVAARQVTADINEQRTQLTLRRLHLAKLRFATWHLQNPSLSCLRTATGPKPQGSSRDGTPPLPAIIAATVHRNLVSSRSAVLMSACFCPCCSSALNLALLSQRLPFYPRQACAALCSAVTVSPFRPEYSAHQLHSAVAKASIPPATDSPSHRTGRHDSPASMAPESMRAQSSNRDRIQLAPALSDLTAGPHIAGAR
jgi:hypothetical protein